MRYYLAPLDGITNRLYRNTYHRLFEPFDKYFTPFVSTDPNVDLNRNEIEELLPENQLDQTLVPQILANDAGEFIKTANAIHKMGYPEINLNLGCPSKAVASRNRGSSFLFHTEALDRFLDGIFTHTRPKISVKTRLGKYDPNEFYHLTELFKKYPMVELIIHPRVQKDYYNNTPNWDMVEEVLPQFPFPVCLNGDIFTRSDFETLKKRFPTVDRVMLGRGIIKNPFLIGEIKKGLSYDFTKISRFHTEMYQGTKDAARTETKVLNVMKGFWTPLLPLIPNGLSYDRAIKTCSTLQAYDALIENLLDQLEAHGSLKTESALSDL